MLGSVIWCCSKTHVLCQDYGHFLFDVLRGLTVVYGGADGPSVPTGQADYGGGGAGRQGGIPLGECPPWQARHPPTPVNTWL